MTEFKAAKQVIEFKACEGGDGIKVWGASPRIVTPKAFANSSPGFELARTLGHIFKSRPNPERVRRLANPFRVDLEFWF